MNTERASRPSGELVETILETLRYVFASILLQTDDLLFALAGSVEPGDELNVHLDALRFLRTLRSPWPLEASLALRAIWADEQGRAPRNAGNDHLRYGLDAFSRHIEALHHPLIYSIERRLQSVSPEERSFLTVDALKPTTLVQALEQGLAGYGATPEINLLLIRLLDQLLAPALGDFYAEVEQTLASHGICPSHSTPLDIDHEASGIMDKTALLAHLDRLQAAAARNPATGQEGWSRDPLDLPKDATLPPPLKRRMELVGLLMYDNLTETDIPPTFKASLSRLRIPMLKAGLLDESLITRPDHPARRLWQGLIELARAPATAPAPWQARVHGLIEHLTHHFGHDLSIFDQAIQELAGIRQAAPPLPRTASTALTASTASTAPSPAAPRISFEEARGSALNSIRGALADRKTPNILRAFLMQVWGPLLIQLLQDEGHGSGSHGQARELMEQLIQRSSAASRAEPPVDTLNAMLAFMQARQLKPQMADYLIVQLKAALTHPAPPPASPSPMQRAMPASPRPSIPAQAIEDFLRIAVMPGDWYLVHAGEGETARRLKVLQTDSTRSVVVFADRLDAPILQRPIQAFIEDILDQRSHPIFEEERHGHAMKQLRRQLGSSSG